MKNEVFFEEMLVEHSKIAENLQKYGGKVIKYDGFSSTYLCLNNKLSKLYNRRQGEYISYIISSEYNQEMLIDKVALSIKSLMPTYKNKKALIVGLGNRFVTADSLGESTLLKIENNKNIQKISPSVKSITNIESTSVVKAIVKHEQPNVVIIIDSLATRDINKLCSSIQITNAGIVAGGGAYASDKLFSFQSLKVPVIAIGVPLIINLSQNADITKNLLCPHKIDYYVDILAEVLAKSITKALS